MGLFDNLMGISSDADPQKVVEQLASARVLLEGERVIHAFQLYRDLAVFTDWRIISIDVQGMTGKKRSYQSIPYFSISRFSVETAGSLDRDAEIDIYLSSATTPTLALEVRSDDAVIKIQQLLAQRLRGS
ncbi:helicase [Corynebacterium yudongzhengii]|uniref:PH domain-containing protein n=1 Tax=Corynebacterium yudongzhengii TaxID=2080740 RepID=A0A2U1T4B8_9CORY|nr:PH domain-containing protein [Corynebacterium yudongzhengii]AWB82856.1 helicase [Corynebacterium yudongzhengii]PWC00849.1 PH domain-containing protein [Corynebacterium yudongzhengii]